MRVKSVIPSLSCRSTQKRGFTLIELMVVIAIIAILASITIPVIGRALESARRAQARTEIASIQTAIRAYFNEYGRYPFGSGQPDVTYLEGNAELIEVLRDPNHERNPRGIIFIEVPDRSLDESLGFIDPWENPYRIAIDTNFDNSVDTQDFGTLEFQTIAVWSMGEENDESTALKSWD